MYLHCTHQHTAPLLQLRRELLAEIVSDDALKAPEEAAVFTAVAAWVSCDSRKSERAQYSDALLAHVRFALIDAACLAEVVECHPLMQSTRGKVSVVCYCYYNYCMQATSHDFKLENIVSYLC
jgi:BTB And C-terminal Kelch